MPIRSTRRCSSSCALRPPRRGAGGALRSRGMSRCARCATENPAGAPVAPADDAARAVRAGVDMQAVIAEVNQPLRDRHGVSFALRVGINTGEVLAGTVGEGYTVVGGAVNVAGRLQAAARPGTVTVGERTFRASSQAIEYQALQAPLALKGKSEAVEAWEALRPLSRTTGARR